MVWVTVNPRDSGGEKALFRVEMKAAGCELAFAAFPLIAAILGEPAMLLAYLGDN